MHTYINATYILLRYCLGGSVIHVERAHETEKWLPGLKQVASLWMQQQKQESGGDNGARPAASRPMSTLLRSLRDGAASRPSGIVAREVSQNAAQVQRRSSQRLEAEIELSAAGNHERRENMSC